MVSFFRSGGSLRARREPAVDANQAGADAAGKNQDHHEQSDAVSDARIDRIEVHDFRKEGDDECADERAIEETGAAKHDHEGEIEARKGAVEAGRNVEEIVELKDAGGTGESAAHHEDADLVQVDVDADGSGERR